MVLDHKLVTEEGRILGFLLDHGAEQVLTTCDVTRVLVMTVTVITTGCWAELAPDNWTAI